MIVTNLMKFLHIIDHLGQNYTQHKTCKPSNIFCPCSHLTAMERAPVIGGQFHSNAHNQSPLPPTNESLPFTNIGPWGCRKELRKQNRAWKTATTKCTVYSQSTSSIPKREGKESSSAIFWHCKGPPWNVSHFGGLLLHGRKREEKVNCFHTSNVRPDFQLAANLLKQGMCPPQSTFSWISSSDFWRARTSREKKDEQGPELQLQDRAPGRGLRGEDLLRPQIRRGHLQWQAHHYPSGEKLA